MPKTKLPWRTLAPPGPSGRLDPELVRKAILEVKALTEAKEARARARARKARASTGRQAGRSRRCRRGAGTTGACS